ncbi:hypothetical protein [Thiolapillus sp.]
MLGHKKNRFWKYGIGMLLVPVCACADVPPLVDDPGGNHRAWVRFESWVRGALADRKPYGFRARDAALAGRLSGREAYCRLAVTMVEKQVVGAEKAISAGLRPRIAEDSYLQVGPMLSDLAVTMDWCGHLLEEEQKSRWTVYAEQTLTNVWNPTDAAWGGKAYPWSGWGIDNPGNNYYYSFLEATQYWALASDSQYWLRVLKEDKWPHVAAYFSNYHGGGSREGTGYGLSHAKLFEVYRTWLRSGQASIPALDRLVRESMEYWVHATVPTLDMVAAIGDQARVSMPVMYDYHRKLMLLAYALAPESREARNAAWWLRHINLQEMGDGANFRYDLLQLGKGQKPDKTWYYSPGAGHLFARTTWNQGALWMSMVAGIYDEDHAHQDQGSFALYQRKWLTVTENVFTHSGIQQNTDVQNLLRFVTPEGDVGQKFSKNNLRVKSDGSRLLIHADLSPAYAHSELVFRWNRMLLFGAKEVVIDDDYAVDDKVQAVWQLNLPRQPRRRGKDIQAGKLCIRPREPVAPEVRIIHWPEVKREYETFRSGWKVELSGGKGRYRVSLFVNGCPPDS